MVVVMVIECEQETTLVVMVSGIKACEANRIK